MVKKFNPENGCENSQKISLKQQKNIEWWNKNPMVYDWEGTLKVEQGTKDFFKAIDQRFFEAHKLFAHPDYPIDIPFSKLINYRELKGKKCLEIGCGAGAIAALLAANGGEVTAIDITKRSIELTQKRFEIFGLKGIIQQGDAEKMVFPNNYFDFIWSWGVIHHTPNPQQAINEVYRVLKHNGCAKIMLYHRKSFRYWIIGGLYQGIIKGNLAKMSLEQVNKSFTDGYIAKCYTQKEAKIMFSSFRRVKISVMEEGENFIPSRKINFVLHKLLSKKIKRRIDLFFKKRYGWFLFIEAVK